MHMYINTYVYIYIYIYIYIYKLPMCTHTHTHTHTSFQFCPSVRPSFWDQWRWYTPWNVEYTFNFNRIVNETHLINYMLCRSIVLSRNIQKKEFPLWHNGIGSLLGALGCRFHPPTETVGQSLAQKLHMPQGGNKYVSSRGEKNKIETECVNWKKAKNSKWNGWAFHTTRSKLLDTIFLLNVLFNAIAFHC